MSSTPIQKLREVTRNRERLRRNWDGRRNRDLLGLLQLAIPRLIPCERFGLFVLDHSNDRLWLEVGTGVIERAIVVDAENSMVGEAILRRVIVASHGLTESDGAHQAISQDVGFVPRDALTAPILSPKDGSAIGALQVLNRKGSDSWSEEDATLLEEIAHTIAGATSLMHAGQHLLTEARSLDEEIAHLDQTESAIRGGHMLRTFEPAKEMAGGGFLHNRYGGTMYPPFIDSMATQDLAQSWDTEPNDIFICTHQKVGTHLAKKFLVELVRTAMDLPADNIYATGDIGHGTVPWPEVMYSQHGRAHWENHVAQTYDQPRIWYVHCSYQDLPVHRIHPKTRFVTVFRDPRAVAVSQYFFWKRHPLLQVPADLDLDAFVERFVDGNLYFGDYHRHVLGWLHRKDLRVTPQQLLALRYEDLVDRKMDCARTLAQFIGCDATMTDKQLAKIVATTEFDKMKLEVTENPQSFHLNPKVYFRSGKSRDWEQHLSPLSVDTIDAKSKELWSGQVECPPLEGVMTLDT